MKSSPILHFRSRFNSTAMIMAKNLFFLLLSLLVAASAQNTPASVNIDCGGSSNSYTDTVTGIIWEGDDGYISTGENKVVQTTNSVSQEMRTLRVFTTRKKNCYSVNVSSVSGTKGFIRASFYYGNYDLKSSPPTFDLQFNGNNWAAVVTSSDQVVYSEVLFTVTGDTVSVCLAQTQPNQFPFISALQLRALDSGMYQDIDTNIHALFLTSRLAFGTNQTTRFPNDPFDRIWTAFPPPNGLMAVAIDAPVADSPYCPDCPPDSVLQYAVTTANASFTEILISFNNLPRNAVPVYITWYFIDNDPTQSRSFTIDVNGSAIGRPITPLYATATEYYTSNFSASSTTNFSLVSTSNSLPPIISAMEVFEISAPLTNGTYSNDLNALGILQTQFVELAGWSGDPCLPSPYTWDWVACNSDAMSPRVTALYLNGYGLSGTLPDFGSMVALQTIDLHNNSLTGEIPNFLGNLPSLTKLNLANNDLSGSVPTSLSSNKNLKLDVSGNQKLCIPGSGNSCGISIPSSSGGSTPSSSGGSTPSSTTPSTSSGKSSSKLPIILGVTIPVVVLSLVIAAFVTFKLKRKTVATPATMNAGSGPPQRPAITPASTPSNIGQMPTTATNGQHEANIDVRVELQHNIQDELYDLMDQAAHQEHYIRSPAPLLHKQ